jgi:hypothetical protein
LKEIVWKLSVIQIVEVLWIVVECLGGELEEMEIDGWFGAVGAVGPFSVCGMEGGPDFNDGLEDTVDVNGGA